MTNSKCFMFCFAQCITLVDYYSSIFFSYVSSVQSDDFCRKYNLCHEMEIFSAKHQEDSCSICQHAISEVLVKLKDPDTQVCIWLLASMDNDYKGCFALLPHHLEFWMQLVNQSRMLDHCFLDQWPTKDQKAPIWQSICWTD